MKKTLILSIIVIAILRIISIYYRGEIERYSNKKELDHYFELLKVGEPKKIIVSSHDFSDTIKFKNGIQRIFFNKDSINFIVNSIISSKGNSYSHPQVICHYYIMINLPKSENLYCEVFNSRNYGTVFILFNSRLEILSSYRNDDLNRVICDYFE